jgi:hypothetical protein
MRLLCDARSASSLRHHRAASVDGELEIVEIQCDRLAVLVILNDGLAIALGWFGLLLLFALLHLLGFFYALFLASSLF